MATDAAPSDMSIYDTNLAHTDTKVHYHNVSSLDEAYKLSGFDQGAIVPHREMVLILNAALRDTEQARIKAVSEKRYKDAARLSKVQDLMRRQFRARQQAQLVRQQDHELHQMKLASDIIRSKFKRDWGRKMEQVVEECDVADSLLHQKQAKGRHMLRRRIKSLPKPKNRMSKQMIALMHAEGHMARNHQYRDAAELNRRIKKQLPVEKARFRKIYENRIERLRTNHGQKEEFDKDLLFEKNKLAKLRIRQERELATVELKRQLANHERALCHALANELNEPAGYRRTVKPVVERRKNYHKTSSVHRGTQVLASVSHARLEAPSLCAMHDFDAAAPTSTLSWGEFKRSKELGFTKERGPDDWEAAYRAAEAGEENPMLQTARYKQIDTVVEGQSGDDEDNEEKDPRYIEGHEQFVPPEKRWWEWIDEVESQQPDFTDEYIAKCREEKALSDDPIPKIGQGWRDWEEAKEAAAEAAADEAAADEDGERQPGEEGKGGD